MHNRFGFDSDTTLSADWPLDIKTKSLRRDSSSDFTHVCAAITDERERQRQTDRQADRQTGTYTVCVCVRERERDRQTDRQTERVCVCVAL